MTTAAQNFNTPLKFSANLGFLWTELTLPDAIHAAANAGFDAVECHWPYAYDTNDIIHALHSTGLPMLGLNTDRGGDGQFGLTALPGAEAKARDAIMSALDYAAATNTRAVHVMAGRASGQAAETAFLENLTFAMAAAADRNIIVLIEPINTLDVPGYFLNTIAQASNLITAVNHPSLKIMFDCYHVAMMGGDVIADLEKYMPMIGHIQFAGVPSRGRPDEGDLDYGPILKTIQNLGWDMPLGAEYKPAPINPASSAQSAADDSLGWLSTFRRIS